MGVTPFRSPDHHHTGLHHLYPLLQGTAVDADDVRIVWHWALVSTQTRQSSLGFGDESTTGYITSQRL